MDLITFLRNQCKRVFAEFRRTTALHQIEDSNGKHELKTKINAMLLKNNT